jgi:hypothetical protein
MGTGPPGAQATIVAGTKVLSFTGLNTTTPIVEYADTGVDRSQALWLTGYQTTPTDGPVAVQSVYILQGGTWEVTVGLLGLDPTATGAAMRVFYTHTA